MIKDKKLLALIPARGGSKAIPDKNIKNLNGKPLIAWTIEAARKSRYIDKVVVSTDDDEIMTIAKKYGSEAPFKRPKELASDNAKMMDVVIHCIKFFQNSGEEYDIIILLQPTAPLRSTYDIDRAIGYFVKKKAQAVISVVACEHSPQWAGVLPHDHNMKNFIPENIREKNRQEIKAFHRINGAVYLADIDFIMHKRDWYGTKTFAYVMKRENSVDIDNLFDFMLAEFIMNRKRSL